METDLNESEQIMADFVLHNATFGAYTGYALILFICVISLCSFWYKCFNEIYYSYNDLLGLWQFIGKEKLVTS